MSENFQKFLTTPEIAKILRKSVAWAERARWAGDGPPFKKIGRTVLYPENELIAWIEKHALKTSTSAEVRDDDPNA